MIKVTLDRKTGQVINFYSKEDEKSDQILNEFSESLNHYLKEI